MMADVLAKLREKMAQSNIDAVILMDGANRRYFTGFTGTAGTALVTEKDAYFLTDSRYTIQATHQCPRFNVMELSGRLALDF